MSSPTLTGEAARQYIENLKAQGVPVMRPHHDPRLATMTMEEQQAYLADFLENGPPPEGPVRQENPPSSPAAPAGGGFRPGTLALPARSERYTLPNGQTLWVHPCSMEEAIWVNTRALEDTGKEHGLTANDPGWGSREVQLESTLRGQVYQVIACCRQGPEAEAPKFFAPSDAAVLRREPGYVGAVQAICAISDGLTAGKGEAEALKEAMGRFFGVVGEEWGKTWLSLLKTDSSPTLMEPFLGALEDFARSACAFTQPSALSAGTLTTFAWQLQQQTPSSAPSAENSEPALTVVSGGEE